MIEILIQYKPHYYTIFDEMLVHTSTYVSIVYTNTVSTYVSGGTLLVFHPGYTISKVCIRGCYTIKNTISYINVRLYVKMILVSTCFIHICVFNANRKISMNRRSIMP